MCCVDNTNSEYAVSVEKAYKVYRRWHTSQGDRINLFLAALGGAEATLLNVWMIVYAGSSLRERIGSKTVMCMYCDQQKSSDHIRYAKCAYAKLYTSAGEPKNCVGL